MEQTEDEFQALQGMLEGLRCVADYADDFYMLLDLHARVRYVNDYAISQIAGIADSAVGSSVRDVFPSLAKDFDHHLARVIVSGEAHSFEHLVPLQGEAKCFEFRVSPVKKSDGTVVALLCTAHDITMRKVQEDLVLRSKQNWVRAVDGMPQLLAVVDGNHRIERINANMAARLKLSVRKTVGMICYKLLHGLKKPPPYCPLHSAATGVKPQRIDTIDKHLGCEVCSVAPLWDSQGNVTGCIYIGQPVRTTAGGAELDHCVRTLMRTVDYIVRIQDIEGRYLFFAAIERGNIKHAEVGGKTPFEFFDGALACRMVERVRRVAVTGRDLTESSEVGWLGETFHFLDHLSPLKDPSGEIQWIVTISKKVAESKRANDGLPKLGPEVRNLSSREREVLQLIGQGASGREIADRLGISLKTVETHRARIMQKLDLHKSSELVRYAIQAGLC